MIVVGAKHFTLSQESQGVWRLTSFSITVDDYVGGKML